MSDTPLNNDSTQFRFDKTINLGNVVSIALCLGAIMTQWSYMDKRVLVLEVAQVSQKERDAQQDTVAKDNLLVLREALRDLKGSVEKVVDKLDSHK